MNQASRCEDNEYPSKPEEIDEIELHRSHCSGDEKLSLGRESDRAGGTERAERIEAVNWRTLGEQQSGLKSQVGRGEGRQSMPSPASRRDRAGAVFEPGELQYKRATGPYSQLRGPAQVWR